MTTSILSVLVLSFFLSSAAVAGPGGDPVTDGLGRYQVHNNASMQPVGSLIVVDPDRNPATPLDYTVFYTPGDSSSDQVVIGDWDGDGTLNYGAVRANGPNLLWILDTAGGLTFRLFGSAGDTPVAGNWDPTDDAWELGVASPNGPSLLWTVEDSGGAISRQLFGNATDTPAPGNWDGSAGTDPGVTRNLGGGSLLWITQGSPSVVKRQFGNVGDTNYPGDFSGDGTTNLGTRIAGSNVFRLDTGSGLSYVQFAAPSSELVNPGNLGQ